MSAAQVACHVAARAMAQELRTSRALGMEWRSAMDASHKVLDDILMMAAEVPVYPPAPDDWWAGS